MKKLIFFLILLPTVAFSQENLKKSAEDFVTSYFKLWEDKKWDEILNSFTDDAQVIGYRSARLVKTALKSMVEGYKINLESYKLDIESISTDVVSPTSAFVTINFLSTEIDKSGKAQVGQGMEMFLLELKDNSWKIKKVIPITSPPVIYNKDVDQKFQTGILSPSSRLNGAMNQMGGIMKYNIEYFKKNGTTPAELGKMMGLRFAKTWDQSLGFAGLVSGFLWSLQTMSTYIEVLERSETTFKVRFVPFSVSETWDVTREDILSMFQNNWNEIADYMGGTCSVVDDGKYMLLTLNKK